ncbi:MAG TPA: transposase [Chlamydiales bacterium]|nr:transposase [Chlamydiales bacterium]
MKRISELQTTLSYFFDWNKCRLNCLVQILQALFAVRTVNLTQIAAAFKTTVKEESSYRRVCRFFTGFSFDLSSIFPLVSHLFPLGDKYTLILDRTNWKWGKSPINILVLSVAYRGISIPIFWAVLDLEGASCVGDRVAILKRAIQKLGVEKIEVLLADREFIGTEWFGFLITNKIPFVIRIKQNSYLKTKEGGTILAGGLRKYLGRKKILNFPLFYGGIHSMFPLNEEEAPRNR